MNISLNFKTDTMELKDAEKAKKLFEELKDLNKHKEFFESKKHKGLAHFEIHQHYGLEPPEHFIIKIPRRFNEIFLEALDRSIKNIEQEIKSI